MANERRGCVESEGWVWQMLLDKGEVTFLPVLVPAREMFGVGRVADWKGPSPWARGPLFASL